MNERRYKYEHLRLYRGVLTSEVQNGNFKMELKIEDNPVLEKSEKIEFSIELEFKFDYLYSLQFFHNIHSCQIEKCSECEKVESRYSKFERDISSLQLGDTFEISAALINNGYSELPREIGDFKAYESLLVACPNYYSQNTLRLPDTIEGINKKREYFKKKKREEKKHRWASKKRAVQTFRKKLSAQLSSLFNHWLVRGIIVGLIAGIILLVLGDSIKQLILTATQDSG